MSIFRVKKGAENFISGTVKILKLLFEFIHKLLSQSFRK